MLRGRVSAQGISSGTSTVTLVRSMLRVQQSDHLVIIRGIRSDVVETLSSFASTATQVRTSERGTITRSARVHGNAAPEDIGLWRTLHGSVRAHRSGAADVDEPPVAERRKAPGSDLIGTDASASSAKVLSKRLCHELYTIRCY